MRTDAAAASQETCQVVFCVFGFAAVAVQGGTCGKKDLYLVCFLFVVFLVSVLYVATVTR